MKTRIHLALEYSPLDVEARQELWKHSLNAIPKEEQNLNIDHVSEDLAPVILNGRQIVNAIHTARTIARFEGGVLKLRHLNMVLYYLCKSRKTCDWLDSYDDPADPWVVEEFFNYPWPEKPEDLDEG